MTLHFDSCLESAIYFDAFEHTTCEVLSTVLRSGDVFIDVGANVGFFSMMAARLVGAQGKVIAFEPNPAAYALLRGTCNSNGYSHIVEIRECALSDVAKVVPFYVPAVGDSGLASLRPLPRLRAVERSVVARRLDDEAAGLGKLKLIKVDVEGGELDVLRGGRRLLERLRPHVICEANPETAGRFGYDPSDIVRYFVNVLAGYRLNLLTSRGIVHNVREFDKGVRIPKLENLWFAPDGAHNT